MDYSEDAGQIAEWIPLVMKGRDRSQKVAATWTEMGTDVNFGEITRQLIASLAKNPISACACVRRCVTSLA